MTADELRQAVVDELIAIAPEFTPDEIDAGADLREEMDIDSMDFLNFVIALHKKLGVDIPETDYPKLFTVNGAVDYLATKAP